MRNLWAAATYLGCALHGAGVEVLPVKDVKFECIQFIIGRDEGLSEAYIVFAGRLVDVTLLRALAVVLD